MGSFVSVRGWIECDPESADRVRAAILREPGSAAALAPPPELATEYLLGWRFPDRTFNWTAYVFFGADVREQYLEWLQASLARAATTDPESEGYFRLDGDHVSCTWNIQQGKVTELPQPDAADPGG